MKKQLFLGLLAAGLFTACSNSDDALSPGSKGNGLEGDKYLSFAINLPTVPMQKGLNDDYQDGTDNEYAVENATLVLFEGATEAAATVASAYDLNLIWNTGATDNVTTVAKVVQKISSAPATGNKFYAMVILNRNDLFSVVDDKLYAKGGTVDLTGLKLEDFNTTAAYILSEDPSAIGNVSKLVNGNGKTAKNFFMTNAPLFDTKGGAYVPTGGKVLTLAEIDPTQIYETEAEALNNPATEVFVERAVAKVTVTDLAAGTTTGSAHLAYTIEGWKLNNTNTQSYILRNTKTAAPWWGYKSNSTISITDLYRFVGSLEVGTTGLYRTYWAEDPNYNTGFNRYVGGDATTTPVAANVYGIGAGMNYWSTPGTWNSAAAADEDVEYCAENTFNVGSQNDINTTAAVVAVQFNSGTSFFTVNKNEGALCNEAQAKDAVKALFLSNATIATALKDYIEYPNILDGSDITVTFGTIAAGNIEIAEIEVAGSKLKSAYSSGVKASVETISGTPWLSIINNNNTVLYYEGGMSYYPIKIKHFGDESTPWRNGDTPNPTVSNIYPGLNEANYLGRYGVLRNNWYDLQVTAIKNIGSPTVPSLGTDPEDAPPHEDDDIDLYLSVKINILAWAKRTQGAILK